MPGATSVHSATLLSAVLTPPSHAMPPTITTQSSAPLRRLLMAKSPGSPTRKRGYRRLSGTPGLSYSFASQQQQRDVVLQLGGTAEALDGEASFLGAGLQGYIGREAACDVDQAVDAEHVV